MRDFIFFWTGFALGSLLDTKIIPFIVNKIYEIKSKRR